ncbi:MAG: hypothetical protein LBH09_08130 [Peptococcaceae bacterium]|jgi:hypothetical protein|nr:hypothetical protein [Peptococcaceae bacterium]
MTRKVGSRQFWHGKLGGLAGRRLWQDKQGGLAGRRLLQDKLGSLTVEALLILPIILLLMALFLRWGLMLREDIDIAAGLREDTSQTQDTPFDPLAEIGFFHGGPPARRIRDADLIIEMGYSIKEKLPAWIQKARGN